jgi:tetratricopeptide (TPR) repeat protein
VARFPDSSLAHQMLGWALSTDLKYPEAEREDRRATELDPDRIWPSILLLDVLTRQQNLAAYDVEAARIAARNPDCWTAQFYQLRTFRRKNDRAAAEALCRKYIQRFPKRAVAHLELARVFHERGDAAGARKVEQHAQTLDCHGFDAQEALIQLSKFTKDPRAQELALRRRCDLYPRVAGIKIEMGSFYAQHRRLAEAENEFRLSCALAPRWITPGYCLADVLYQEKKLDEALAVCDRLLELPGRSASVEHLRGLIFSARGDIVRARRAFARARDLEPTHEPYWAQLAGTHLVVQDHAGTLSVAREALASFPRSVILRTYLASALAGLKRYAESIREFQAVLEQAPHSTARFELARTLGQHGDLERARREFDAALKANPRDATGHIFYVGFLSEHGTAKEHVDQIRNLLRVIPDDLALRCGMAMSLTTRRLWAQADEALAPVRQLSKLNPTQLALLADVDRHLGRLAQAEKECRTGLSIKPDDTRLRQVLADVLVSQGRVEEAFRSQFGSRNDK